MINILYSSDWNTAATITQQQQQCIEMIFSDTSYHQFLEQLKPAVVQKGMQGLFLHQLLPVQEPYRMVSALVQPSREKVVTTPVTSKEAEAEVRPHIKLSSHTAYGHKEAVFKIPSVLVNMVLWVGTCGCSVQEVSLAHPHRFSDAAFPVCLHLIVPSTLPPHSGWSE